jgi:hypothetical protein
VTGNPRATLAADGIIDTRLNAVGYEAEPVTPGA